MPAVGARSKGFPFRGLLIFIIVGVVVLVAADRTALSVAEGKVASKVQTSQHLAEKPTVHIEGFPFLTQVIANRYRVVSLAATGLDVGGGEQIAISTLTVRLAGVRAIDNYSGVTADTVDGTALIGYQELSRVVGVSLGYGGASADGNGRVQASESVNVLGETVRGTVSAEVGVTAGQLLQFSAVKIDIANTAVSVPPSATNQLASIFKKQLSLSGLPFGLRVQTLVATPAGVEVAAIAHNVELR